MLKKFLKKVLQKKKKYSRLQIHVTSTLKGDTMKKILALSLLLSSAAFAGHEEGSRWGLGLRAGVGAFAGKLNQVLTINAGSYSGTTAPTTVYPIDIQTLCNNNGYTSFQGGAFLEFGYRSCDWSFGALIDVNGDTLKKTYLNIKQQPYTINLTAATAAAGETIATTLSGSTVASKFNLQTSTIKAPIHVGGDIRGGMYFGDALWYVLVGGEGIQIKHSSYASVNYLLDAQNAAGLNTTPAAAAAAADITATFTMTGITPLANPLIIGVPYYSNDCNTSCNTVCATPAVANCNTSCNYDNNCNSSWRGALRVGTGIEYNWSDCFNVKLEYRFLWAGKKCYTLSSVHDSTKPASFNVITSTVPATATAAGTVVLASALASGTIVDTLYFRQHVTALMFSYQF